MGLIFRSTSLPEKSGPWGLLLPRHNEPGQENIKASAGDLIRKINPNYIEFVNTYNVSNRGFGLFMWGGGAALSLLMSIPLWLRFQEAVERIGFFHSFITALIPAVMLMLMGLAAFHAARAPLAPAVILSHKLRKFYQWQGKKQGWISVDYDTATPHVNLGVVATQGGGYSYFRLLVANLEPKSRNVINCITVSDPSKGAQPACELWEFIRIYMGESPASLPKAPYMPPLEMRSAFNARLDRDIFKNMINKDHHIVAGFLHYVYVWYSGIVQYWMYWLMAFIERTAPQVPYPTDLQNTMQFQGENIYSPTPPSSVELSAMKGQLSHLNRRWNIAKYLSTLLWSSALIGMFYIAWFVY